MAAVDFVDCVWNVMAHAQKPDFVFRWNGRVHLNRQGRQFSRLLAAEVWASAVVMLDTPCFRGSVKSTGYPLHLPVSPSLPLPCVAVCLQVSTGVYHNLEKYGNFNAHIWLGFEQLTACIKLLLSFQFTSANRRNVEAKHEKYCTELNWNVALHPN
jgi:hypothetical protein